MFEVFPGSPSLNMDAKQTHPLEQTRLSNNNNNNNNMYFM